MARSADGAGLKDEAVLSLAARIELIEDQEFSRLFPAERWAVVEISLMNGDRIVSRRAVARGSAENPLSDAEIRAKYTMLMRESGFGERAGRTEDMVLGLGDLPDAHVLSAELARR